MALALGDMVFEVAGGVVVAGTGDGLGGPGSTMSDYAATK